MPVKGLFVTSDMPTQQASQDRPIGSMATPSIFGRMGEPVARLCSSWALAHLASNFNRLWRSFDRVGGQGRDFFFLCF